jgi:hypothetical protein
MVAFTYFLPFLCHWRLFPDDAVGWRAAWYAANGAIGVAIMVSGVYAAIADLADSSAGLGFGKGNCSIAREDARYRGCSGGDG